ncbi:myristoyl transferase [Mesorhizobium sp. M9A.F.Ca.ET.002.03.1.2]|uniref:ABC transporter substrate-binding protein n=1 Tax=Mesorhizobium sp. M9A.F.Ca.ET.002.03.1.2 TaxID=2493668 RepID=UPI000F75273F|nr:ABC transporter substrate-binding protein [Mesorhizobium sp. M9A.F.Ca.ET.002.03.1.2]AZO00918.1 myristoyl transferase [Mesorhizobium sp. M9A.F.Ca.ET.002.03.1.2]
MKSSLRIALSAALVLASSQFAFSADQIRILAPTWLGFAPVHIAGDLGCFAGKDLDVSIKFEDDLTNVMAAMARGDIEMQMRSVGEYQGRPRDASTPGIIIGTIDESVGGDGVITDDKIKTVADLKGKVVAAEPNIPSRLLLQMELKQAGLSLKDLQIKDIATADTGAVFVDDSIAAIATYEPFMSQALKASTRPGARMLVSSKDHRGIIIDAIIARNDDFEANPDKYAKFLGCIYEAVDFLKAEPEKFADMASKHFGLTAAEVTEIVDSSLSYTTLAESLAYMGKPGEKGTLHGIFETVMDLNLENGAADNKLVATEQIDNSAINKVTAK